MIAFRRFIENPYFALTSRDKVAVGYFICFSIFTLLYFFFILLPHSYPKPEAFPSRILLHFIAISFLYINIYISFIKVFVNPCHVKYGLTDSNLPLFKTSVEKEGGSCSVCHIPKPPRSQHCRKCNVCILKRDHHCIFCGTCIGYFNQRYYFTLMLHMACLSTYFNIYQAKFVTDQIGHHGYTTPFCFLAPHILFMVGQMTLWESIICTVTLKTLALFFFSWGLLIQQSVLIIKGQTRYERKRNLLNFNKGVVDNIVSVLGKNWYLAWIFPLVTSSLPGDGHFHDENSKLV